MSESNLTCRELVEIITDYLEARLPAPARARFEAHLARCAGCTAYLEQVRRTVQCLGRLGAEGAPPPDCAHLLDLFRAWRVPDPPPDG